jgi:endonuclease/exonuclease/phosphatase family metal-dependent hydrolase
VLSTIFYATPWVVLAGLSLVAAFWSTRRRLTRLTWILSAVLCVVLWYVKDVRWSPPPAAVSQSTHKFSLLFWNLNRPETHPKTALLELMQQHRPTLMAAVETEGLTEKEIAAYQAALPGYTVLRLSGDMLCLTQWQHEGTAFHKLGKGSKAAQVILKTPDGRRLDLFIVDLHADPKIHRKQPLQTLWELVQQHPRCLVAGDFNTPGDSCWFDAWYEQYFHAWQEAGEAVCQTWPYGLPVLALDHVWASRNFGIVRHQTGYCYHGGSDHAWLLTELH